MLFRFGPLRADTSAIDGTALKAWGHACDPCGLGDLNRYARQTSLPCIFQDDNSQPLNRLRSGDNEIVTVRECMNVRDKWLELIQDAVDTLQKPTRTALRSALIYG